MTEDRRKRLHEALKRTSDYGLKHDLDKMIQAGDADPDTAEYIQMIRDEQTRRESEKKNGPKV